jgi:hypothetical protein
MKTIQTQKINIPWVLGEPDEEVEKIAKKKKVKPQELRLEDTLKNVGTKTYAVAINYRGIQQDACKTERG